MSLKDGTAVVLVFDTDAGNLTVLKENIKLLQTQRNISEVICVLQVKNLEDELVRSCNIKQIKVTVQNPSGSMTNCCAKQRIEKIFSALNCCCFVDKNDDLLSIYPPCG